MTDDSAAFGAAIAYLTTIGLGTLFVPAGEYCVQDVEILSGNITIEGAGSNSTRILNLSANTPAIKYGDGITLRYGGGVRGMSFASATGVVAASGQHGLLFDKHAQFAVDDVFCNNFPAALYNGVSFTECSQYFLRNVRSQSCVSNGIQTLDSLDFYYSECRADANGGAGWTFSGSEGGYVSSCTGYFNDTHAFSLVSTDPVTDPNKNMFFVSCIGDTSGSYNWQITDLQNSYFTECWGSTNKDVGVNTFATGFLISSQNCKALIFNGCVAINNNSHGFLINDPGASGPTKILLNACHYGSTANGANGNGKSGAGYGLAIAGTLPDSIRVVGGIFDGNASGAYSNTSAQTDIFVMANPIGLRTVNQGVAAFAGGVTAAVVNHGLGVTPTAAGIMLTPASNGAPGGTTSWWVTGITSTQFTINLNANTAGFNVSWRAAARAE